MGKQVIHIKRELHATKRGGVTCTIDTKFGKFGNKASMLENSNEVDEEKETKDNNILLSRDPTASFPSGILETLDKRKLFLMTKQRKTHTKIPLEI